MSRKRRARLRALADLVSEAFPGLDPLWAIARGWILVNGYPVTTPNSLVRADASIRVREPHLLRGERKLAAALELFAVPCKGASPSTWAPPQADSPASSCGPVHDRSMP